MSVSETLPTKIRKSPQRPITTKYEEFRFKKNTYKGLTYSYPYAHQWLSKHYGKATRCESSSCTKNSPNYQWSNISHEYRLERSDWRQLCRSCHAKVDTTEKARQKARDTFRGNTYRRKAVLQFSKEGVLLAEFPSTHHASRATGILKTAIYNNTRGVTKTAGGFVWQV